MLFFFLGAQRGFSRLFVWFLVLGRRGTFGNFHELLEGSGPPWADDDGLAARLEHGGDDVAQVDVHVRKEQAVGADQNVVPSDE